MSQKQPSHKQPSQKQPSQELPNQKQRRSNVQAPHIAVTEDRDVNKRTNMSGQGRQK